MSNRRSFLRGCLLGIAISLVPEILRPTVVEDIYDGEKLPSPYYLDEPGQWAMYAHNSHTSYVLGTLYLDEDGKTVRFRKNKNQL